MAAISTSQDYGRYQPLGRILRLARAIERRPVVDLKTCAAEFGVSVRTMRRYLIALEVAGWRVPPWRMNEEQKP